MGLLVRAVKLFCYCLKGHLGAFFTEWFTVGTKHAKQSEKRVLLTPGKTKGYEQKETWYHTTSFKCGYNQNNRNKRGTPNYGITICKGRG